MVTHNKRTMEISDVLLGVTMEEPGISKIISVNLQGISETHGQMV
jgi:chromosome segregation protein